MSVKLEITDKALAALLSKSGDLVLDARAVGGAGGNDPPVVVPPPIPPTGTVTWVNWANPDLTPPKATPDGIVLSDTARHNYSSQQCINTKHVEILLRNTSGGTYSSVALLNKNNVIGLPSWFGGENDFCVMPSGALAFYGHQGSLKGVDILDTDNNRKTLFRLPARIQLPDGTFIDYTYAYTRGEGRPSADFNRWPFLLHDASFNRVGFCVYDVAAGKVIWAARNKGAKTDIDHVKLSNSGKWFIISRVRGSFTGPYVDPLRDPGTWAINIETGEFKRHNTSSHHSDCVTLTDGTDGIMMIHGEGNDPADIQYWLTYAPLDNPAQYTKLHKLYFNGAQSDGTHTSGFVPGWGVVSYYGGDTTKRTRFWDHRIIAWECVRGAPHSGVRGAILGEHVSSWQTNDPDRYLAEPQACIDPTGTYVVFSSKTGGKVRDYLLTCPKFTNT